MSDLGIGVHGASTTLVSDSDYHTTVTKLINIASSHCLCSLFIVDPDPDEDVDLAVDEVLGQLAEAHWRGVDTRLLIGGSRENARIRDVCELAQSRATELEIPVRLLSNTQEQSDHAKLVVVDESVLLGSHNWSAGAFTNQTQDSVLISNAGLAGHFATRFINQWSVAEG